MLALVGRPGTAPGVPAAGRRHEWYPLAEGSVIDLDVLPSGQVTDAAVDRLLRLRPGEQVELRSGRDPWPVWERMDGLFPGGCSAYLQEGPPRWRLQVTRGDCRVTGWPRSRPPEPPGQVAHAGCAGQQQYEAAGTAGATGSPRQLLRIAFEPRPVPVPEAGSCVSR